METYEEIVSRWYSELHDPFVNLIKSRFNGLFFDEIEDIYQETFLAVHENLHRGSIEADTNWRAYIMRIGLNQTMTYCKAKGKFVTASQAGGDDDDERPDWLSYYARMSMEEICQELGYANTDSAKSQRLKCFNKLKEAVRARLKMMGLL